MGAPKAQKPAFIKNTGSLLLLSQMYPPPAAYGLALADSTKCVDYASGLYKHHMCLWEATALREPLYAELAGNAAKRMKAEG